MMVVMKDAKLVEMTVVMMAARTVEMKVAY
jgi:hypothetical protein